MVKADEDEEVDEDEDEDEEVDEDEDVLLDVEPVVGVLPSPEAGGAEGKVAWVGTVVGLAARVGEEVP
jgi:hypothetical protein